MIKDSLIDILCMLILLFFEQTIVDYVEKNHPLDVERIVEGWEVPSYNLIKGLSNSNGNKYCSYVVNIDEDGWLQLVVSMTERNCGYVLNLVLEMVKH